MKNFDGYLSSQIDDCFDSIEKMAIGQNICILCFVVFLIHAKTVEGFPHTAFAHIQMAHVLHEEHNIEYLSHNS